MKLEDWLKDRAGLSGKKLEIALSGCETNLVESVEELRELADEDNEKQFEKVFPQGMLRTALLKALKKDPSAVESEEKASVQIQAKEDASNR